MQAMIRSISPVHRGQTARQVHHPAALIRDRIAISTSEGLHIVRTRSILYCVADGNYSTVCIKGGQTITVSKTLGRINAILKEPYFFRIHQSYLVDIQSITMVMGDSVRLSCGKVLPVARRQRKSLKALFTQHLIRI